MQLGKTAAIFMAAAMGLAMASGTPAAAQEVSTSLTAVQQCLCAQRAVSILGREMRVVQSRDQRMHGDVEAMTRQVDEARHRVNTDNRSDIDAFRALLAHRDQAAQSLRAEDERYADAVARYNVAVERNNAVCSGRLFDPEEMESVKAGLVCPRP